VTWDELPHIYPTDFTVHTVPKRLASTGDPWADILEARHDLASALGLADVNAPA
jgi:DNA primase